jgi:hypothetical protein
VADTELEAVKRVLGELAGKPNNGLSELDDVVRAFARPARREAMPPERLLVKLVSVLNDPSNEGPNEWWRSVLRDRSVRAAIEAYYAIDLVNR